MKRIILLFKTLLVIAILACSSNTFGQSPGGVSSSLRLWLKANTGVTTSGANVTTWNDQSGGANNATTVNGTNPTLVTNSIDYYPVVNFGGAGGMQGSFGTSVTSATTSAFVVTNVNTASVNSSGVLSIAASGTNDGTAASNSVLFERYSTSVSSYRNSAQRGNYSAANALGTYHLFTSEYTTTQNSFFSEGAAANNSAYASAALSDNKYTVGSRYSTTIGNYLTGQVAEVILFDRLVSAAEKNSIESYLAVKYGITLNQSTATNYVNAAGTTIWNAASNGTYNNNIFGIGTDNTSGLSQSSAVSLNTNTLAISGTTPANNNFLIISDNGLTQTSVPYASLPPGYTNKLALNYRVSETGSVGSVNYTFNYSVPSYYSAAGITPPLYMLIDANADGIFETAQPYTSVSGSSFTYAANLPDGAIFSFGFANFIDYGDAPIVPTLISANGAGHKIVAGVYLGSLIDAEADGQVSVNALGDDTIGLADEDGVNFNIGVPTNGINIVQIGQTNTIQVTASTAGYLNAWVDYNQDGTFGGGSEYAIIRKPLVAGVNTVTFLVSDSVEYGPTSMRFRFAQNIGDVTGPTGLATNGEVEDYLVYITAPLVTACTNGFENPDFEIGLTPSTYIITSETNFPYWRTTATDHDVECWHTGFNGVPAYSGTYFVELNANLFGALYQDLYTTPGATFVWHFAHRARVGTDVCNLKIGPPGSTVQVAVATDVTTAWGYYTGVYTVPANQYVTRFEFNAVSTGSGSISVGNFLDDVAVSTSFDYGDAPDSYHTLKISNGPLHNIVPNLHLGTNISCEIDGQPSFNANLDTYDDGVTFPTVCTSCATYTVNISAFNNTGSPATISGWIDLNKNGVFDAAENAQVTIPSSASQQTTSLTFTLTSILATTGPDYVYSRFRIANSAAEVATPVGVASTGEVEDYIINCVGLPVPVASSNGPICNLSNLNLYATGSAPFYQWTGPNGYTSNLQNPVITSAPLIDSGTYTVYALYADGCLTDTTIKVVIRAANIITLSTSKTDITCHGAANGTISTTVSGGTTPYTYIWSNGATTSGLSGLSAGAYTVTVRDASGCIESSATATVNIIEPATLTLAQINTPALCNGGSTGTITLTVSGGTPAYTYLWSNGSTSQNPSGLAAGTYTVTVKDSKLCSATISATITQPAPVTGTGVVTSVSCSGGSDGSIALTPAGGTSPYSYNWGSGVITQNRSNVAAGTYTVTITDANNCIGTASFTVSQLPALTIAETHVNTSCNGGNDGTITLTISGGTPAYSYNWGSGITAQNRTGLAANTYTVTVSDSKGCSAVKAITITQPAALALSSVITPAACNGGNTGAIALTVIGGTAAYTYNWGGGITTQNRTGLATGTYTVTVTDAKGCTAVLASTVSQPPVLNVSSVITAASCNGASNGAINLNVTGGTSPYTYNWGGGITTPDRTNIVAGTYTVTVTDASGCTSSFPSVVTQPSAIAIASTVTNVKCKTGNTGAIALSVSGGTPSYTYLWSNGATSQNVNTLTAGTYNVTITDNNSCSASASIVVSEPAFISIGASTTNVLCYGGSNGAITLNVTGGTPTYTYNWGAGVTTQNRTGLTAGTYAVTATDANSCTAAAVFNLSQPAPIAIPYTKVDVTCNGLSNGSITLAVTGGTAPYSYNWGGGITTQNRTGLVAGTYNVTVTDFRACTAAQSISVIQPAVLALSTTKTNVSCNGGANGTVTLTVAGGTSPYTYNWGLGVTTQNINNLSIGTYTVSVTDNNGCSGTASATITQPTAITLSSTQVNVSCNGGTNGSVTLTSSGGTTPYTYSWSNGATTQNLATLGAGAYTVTVTDANGCQQTLSATISQPAALSVSATKTDVSCNGNNNGTITLTVSGGTTAYTYNWGGGVTTQNRTTLAAGTYTVTVTDAKGCSAVQSVVITQPNVLTVAAAQTNVSCNAGTDGSITLTVAGGTTAYTYNWGGGVTVSNRSNLVAGTYAVTVTDAKGCTATASVTITQPAVLAVSTTKVNVTCNGAANGSINTTVTGGTTAYAYAWSNATTTANQTGLSGGTYTVTITDAHGCTASASVTITEPAVLTLSETHTNVLCSGGNNAAITLTVAGGNTPYTYAWSNATTTQNQTGLTAGTYTVTLTDNKGCSVVKSITITQPTPLVATKTSTNVTCNGAANGTISTTVSGGTSPYTYNWGGGVTLQSRNNLAPGTYTETITDANGCSTTLTTTITQPAVLFATSAQTNVSCNGGTDGTITVTPAGGTTPYIYAWSGGVTTQNRTNLAAGTYPLTITDANGCTISLSATITQPAVLTASNTFVNVSCSGANNGSITTTEAGGTTPYTYAWSNAATTQNLSGLAPGSYTVTVTDAKGCTVATTAVITTPNGLVVTNTSTNIPCNGAANGTISVSTTGGSTPYTYNWGGGITTQNRSNLGPGTYTVTVTDANGCFSTTSATITQPAAMALTDVTANVTCTGASNGSITASLTGGVPTYSYLWSNGATTTNLTGLTPGTYTLTATDGNGCTTTTSVNITEPAPVSTTTTHVDETVHGGSTGSITSTTTGGTPAYSYSWNTGATTANLTGLIAGYYILTVTDANGCTTVASVNVIQPDSLLVSVATTINDSCYGASDGAVLIHVTGGTMPYTYNWANGATSPNLLNVPAGAYAVTITDNFGNTVSNSVLITQPTPVNINGTVTNVTCNGAANGTATTTASGGHPGYTYAWSDGPVTTQNRTNLGPGTYVETVTDTYGCSLTFTAIITQPAVLAVTDVHTDVSCNGGNNGSITTTTTGGTQPYTYNWGGGVTTPNRTALPIGTYNVTVTDANGCTATDAVTITSPTALGISDTYTNVTCNAAANATINITVTGGTTAYTYNWGAGVTTQNRTTLSPGSYTVTATDAHGCTISLTQSITQPAQLTASSTEVNVLCNGGNNGSITLTVAGGTAAYTYAWSDGPITTQNRTSLTAGTYTATVTDANGCTVTNTTTITQPAVLTSSVASVTYVSCQGNNNGAITINVSGGSTPYTYAWSNGAFSQNISSLAASTYTVTITDANACTSTLTQSVTEPLGLGATTTQVNVKCKSDATGSITLTVTGGTAPYTYSWNNGTTTQNQTNLTAGTYTVVITDAKGCNITEVVTITEPTQLAVTAATTNILCNGGNNGSITLTVSGGTSAYTYAWSDGPVTTQNRTVLIAGTYTVTITDANSCTLTKTVTLTQPAVLAATSTQTNVSCNGGSDATITVTPAGGTPPYTYLWNGGQTTQNRSGLAAGTYTLTVTDAHSCTVAISNTITQPNVLTASNVVTNVSCFGGNNGTATLTVAGGTTAYTYAWSNGTLTQNVTGLAQGSYTVTVTDAHSCVATASAVITQPVILAATSTKTNVSCSGGTNGTITLAVTGGTTVYTYAWSDGPVTTQNRTGLAAGTYTVTVTDAHSCTTTQTTVITQPTPLTTSSSTTNVSCNGGADGSINVTVGGGTTPYTYDWGGGIVTSSRSGLSAGTYTLTVTDANSCTALLSATITEPAVLAVTAAQTNISCYLGTNGAITLTTTGGTPAYSYVWSTGSNASSLSGLSAGTYNVTVNDTKACATTLSVVITQPALLAIASSQINVSCNGGADGTLTLTITGGTTPYHYNWSNAATTQNVSGLASSTYTVTVTDVNGCSVTKNFVISQPSKLQLSSTSQNVSCSGGANGSINIAIVGGTAAYSYLWNDGTITQNRNSLAAGAYGLTVTDSKGCSATISVTITQPLPLAVTPTQGNVSCFGGSDGFINIAPVGGTVPYSYNWGGGVVVQNRSGLAAGTYSVTLTDANGCTVVQSATITQPTVLTATATHVDVSCNGGHDGSIAVTPAGGTPAYSYLWSTSATTANISSLPAGAYGVTVSDANGCQNTMSVTIGQASTLAASYSQVNVSCHGGNNGSITLTPSGGTPAYTYLWNNSATTQNRTALTVGTYDVTITDAHGCSIADTIIITEPTQLAVTETHTDIPCNGQNNGTAHVSVTGGVTPYTYNWGSGNTSADLAALTPGTYTATVTDANGCTISISSTIAQPTALTISEVSTNVSCYNTLTGSITVTVGGGTTPYTYIWNDAVTTLSRTNLTIGTYSETVTDAHGCTINTSATITQPTLLTFSATNTNVNCFGGNNATITTTAGGGTTPYTYAWSDGAVTTANRTNLTAGVYGVTLTDAKGCTDTALLHVTQPTQLAMTDSVRNVSCNSGTDGFILLNVSGGTTPYTYNWSDGQTTSNRNNLPIGTYAVSVTDANGCSLTLSETITQPTPLTTSETHVDATCNGFSNGSINLTVGGGVTPYSYVWTNGVTTQNNPNITSGIYTVTVTDAHGCTITQSANVTEPNPMTSTQAHTNVSCFDGSNGTITLGITGGTTPYHIIWNDSVLTQNRTNLPADTFSVIITDVNLCASTQTVIVSQPDTLTASDSAVAVKCFGFSDGDVFSTVKGGTTPYQYAWSNANDSAAIHNVIANTYSLTVTDANSCTATASAVVSQPTQLVSAIASSNVGCHNGANGTITVTPSGGTVPYHYDWSDYASTQTRTNLIIGTYNVTVTDSNSCSITKSVTITQPDSIVISKVTTNVSCFGGSNGTITLTPTGGTLPYAFSWNDGAVTQNRTGIPIGTYTVILTDSNSCHDTLSAIITQPTKLVDSATHVDVSCFGGNNGSINLIVTGGVLPYSFDWGGGITTQNRTNLIAGTYTCTVTDSNSCTTPITVTIAQPTQLVATSTQTKVTCYGLSNAAITLTVSGGTAPYTFAWSDGVLTQNRTGLAAGPYTVSVKDAHNCMMIITDTIIQPALLVATDSTINVSCFAGNNGAITLYVTGGTLPYTYAWADGPTVMNRVNLVAATYTVTVKDSNSCQQIVTATITQPTKLNQAFVLTNVSCNGGNDGAITTTTTGGTAPYTYAWSSGETTQNLTGKAAGTYTQTVTDSHGCSDTTQAVITEPQILVASVTAVTNVSCNGGTDGSITTTTTGGTAPYSYAWSSGETSQNLTGKAAGTYTQTVTDSHGCSDTTQATITEPQILAASITAVTNVSCNGGTDGAITTTTTGGTSPYTYSWSSGETTQNLTGKPAGTYTQTVTDSHGCSDTTQVTITEPQLLVASINTVTNVSCNGGTDGAITTTTTTGGTAPYSYAWSSGETTQNLTGKPAGTYTQTVTDSHGCSDTTQAVITEPQILVASVTAVTNVSCNGGTDGAITTTTTGGTAPYSYAWSSGETTQNLTGKPAGTYTQTVTDSHGCSDTTQATITEPQILVASVSAVTNVSCNGGTDGAITTTTAGGTSPYTYAWSSGETTQNLTGKAAGTYTQTVTDSHGCSDTTQAVITEPQILVASVSAVTNVSCNGGTDGAITTTTTGGTAPYSYAWSSGETTQNLTGKAAGTYTQTVTDSHGCSDTTQATITEPQILAASITAVTNVSCNGGTDGAITTTTTGGTSPYTYSWSSGETTQNLTGKPAGTYTQTVTDSHGCSDTTQVTITEPQLLVASINTVTNVSCNGGTDGAITTTTTTGGTAPYSYAWSSGETTQNLTGKPAGTYTQTVTDSHGCSDTTQAVITEPQILVASVTAVTNVSCNGGTDGAITTTTTGGTAPYSYAWSSGETTQNLTGKPAGTYTQTVTDSHGCSDTTQATITEPQILVASVSAVTNVSCNGGTDGSITTTTTGGTAPYIYAWSSGETSQNLTGKAAGTYTQTVTDSHGCSDTTQAVITEPQILVASVTAVTNVSCNGGTDGAITTNTTGGTAPYSYAWSSGETSQNLTGKAAGTYTQTVTDSHGCSDTTQATITEPQILAASITAVTNVSCNGGTDGAITTTTTGGTSPYTYSWSSGETTQNLTGKPAGTYTQTVTDSHGCSDTTQVTITEPQLLVASINTVTNVSCNGGTDGAITTTTTTGGTAPYSYAWSSGETTQNLTGKPAGTYTQTVTDSHGCSDTTQAVITEPQILVASVTAVTNVSCNGGTDGAITTTTTGGTAPYSYAWSSGETTQNLTGKPAGTYTQTVTDSHGCSDTTQATITEPQILVASVSAVTNVSCNGGTDGAITTTTAGGTSPYTYAWSSGETTQNLTGKAAGTYTQTVTDSHGCSDTTQAVITEPQILVASVTAVTNVSCNGGTDGAITTTTTGGTAPYTYAWSNGETTQNISGKSAGTYTQTVTDSHGCSDTTQAVITEPQILVASVTAVTNVSCNGGTDGSITTTTTGGTAPYIYAWSSGETTQNLTGKSAGTYTQTVTDSHGCSDTTQAVITEPQILVASVTAVTNVSCNGGTDGAITTNTTGGTSPYIYAWSSGETSQNLTGKAAGTYTQTVTDSHGCSDTTQATITEPQILVASITAVTNVSCNGGTDGAITTTTTGGTSPYTYSWSSGETTQNLTGKAAGTYTQTVTDSHGCSDTTQAAITEPQLLVASINTVTNVSCNGGTDGAITTTTTGGTSPYTYAWSSGETTQNINGKAAGTYTQTVTDSHGCSDTTQATITEPQILVASVTAVTNVSCNGGTDGAITTNTTGGTSPYTYSWSSGETTQNLTGKPAGTYTQTVTDSHGCSDTTQAVITEPQILEASVTAVTNVSCNGGTDGAITTTTTGGTAPYTYAWSSGETTQNLTGKAAGTYTQTVTDSHGCSDTTQATIIEPQILIASINTVTNVSCNGGNDGAITTTTTGGTAPYTYAWSSSETTQNLTGKSAGTYTQTVTDSHGCSDTTQAVITEPQILVASVTVVTNVSCNGGTDGAITTNTTGGTSPYIYAWSSGETSQNLTGKAAGTYTQTVTDSHGCSDTTQATITEPQILVASITAVTNVSCNGGTDGAITTTTTGGTSPYTYSWSSGETTQNLTGKPAGTYTQTVTDSHGCSDTTQVTITEPQLLVASINTVTNVSCNGGTDGAITTTTTGGTAPYTYSWSSGETTQNISGKAAGTYTQTVTDSHGCSDTTQAVITEPQILVASVTAVTNVSCNGGTDGAITTTTTGGTAPYSYAWSSGETTQNLTGKPAGTYTQTVTDSHGCSDTTQATITEPQLLVASINTVTNVSCNGGTDGAITTTTAGGTSPYTYAWSSGETTQNLTGKAAGTYTQTVTDSHGCSDTTQATITEPQILVASVSAVTNVSCNGGTDGTITTNTTGGTAPYTYAWSSGETTQNLTGKPAGTYTQTVTDSHGCSDTTQATITEPQLLVASINTVTNVSCNGGTDGAITTNTTGGTAPYTYAWSSGETTQNLTGKPAGTYTQTVTDSHGCSDTTQATITEPQKIVITDVIVTPSCFGTTDGSITLDVTGGTLGYVFSWSNGPGTQNISGLGAGTYTVTVADQHACPLTATYVVSQPDSIQLNTSSTPVLCVGGSSGTISATNVTGGSPSYTYQWSDGATTQMQSGVPQGTYYVTVTDSRGCKNSDSIVVTTIPSMVLGAVTANLPCATAKGFIDVTVAQGTAPYTYTWNNGATTPNINNLDTGTYYLIVMDANGCLTDSTFTIINTNSFHVATSPEVTIELGEQTTIYATSTGSSLVTYNWTPDGIDINCATCASTTAGPVKTTSYIVRAVDTNGCVAIDTVIVNVDANHNLYVPNAFTPNNDGINDYFEFFGNKPAIKYVGIRIFDRWGEKVFDSNDVDFKWDGRFKAEMQEPGVYVYVMDVVFVDGYRIQAQKGSITLIR